MCLCSSSYRLFVRSSDHIYRIKVDSRYLEFQGTLWNTLRYPYLDISDLQKWGKIIRTTTFNKFICNWTLEFRDISRDISKISRDISKISRDMSKILLKRGERSNFSSFPQYFFTCYKIFMLRGTRFSLRDKRLFEISEVEITRVNCIKPPPLFLGGAGELAMPGRFAYYFLCGIRWRCQRQHLSAPYSLKE